MVQVDVLDKTCPASIKAEAIRLLEKMPYWNPASSFQVFGNRTAYVQSILSSRIIIGVKLSKLIPFIKIVLLLSLVNGFGSVDFTVSPSLVTFVFELNPF